MESLSSFEKGTSAKKPKMSYDTSQRGSNNLLKYENAPDPFIVEVSPGGCVHHVIGAIGEIYPEVKPGSAAAYFADNKLKVDYKIYKIIKSVTCDSPIWIRLLTSVPTQGPIVYKHPSLGGVAPSSLIKEQHKKSHDVSIYCHWFALELYKLFEYLANTPSMFTSENIRVAVDDCLFNTKIIIGRSC